MKKIILTIIVLVLIGFAIAQDEVEEEPKEDYSDPNWVNDNFGTSGFDYGNAEIKWGEVDYSKIPADKYSELPYNNPDLNYGKLNYNDVDYTKADQSRIDSGKYMSDMGCGGCQLEGRGNVNFEKNRITHPDGDSVSVPGNYPAGTKFTGTKDRIIVTLPEGTKDIDVPSEDRVTIDTGDKTVTLPDKTTVKGKLSFDKGEKFILQGDSATVNGYKIDNTASEAAVSIEIGKLSTSSNSVSFEKGKVTAKGQGYSVAGPRGIKFDFHGKGGEVVIEDRFPPGTLMTEKIKNDPEQVKALQKILIKEGYLSGKGLETADGKFGDRTASALSRYQADLIEKELLSGVGDETADRKLGKNTIRAITDDVGPQLTVKGDVNFPLNDLHFVDGKVIVNPLAKPGPEMLVIYEKYLIDVTHSNTVIQELTQNNPAPTKDKEGLGSVSEKFESGKQGSKAIGYDSAGGTSYGIYQIASNTNTMNQFLAYLEKTDPEAARLLRESGPLNTGGTTGAAVDTWKRLADAGRVQAAEQEFIKQTHYVPAANYASSQGFDMTNPAIQEMVWSGSVQHGGVNKILKSTASTPGFSTMSTEQQVQTFYSERTEYALRYAPANTHTGIKNRYIQEEKDVIALIK